MKNWLVSLVLVGFIFGSLDAHNLDSKMKKKFLNQLNMYISMPIQTTVGDWYDSSLGFAVHVLTSISFVRRDIDSYEKGLSKDPKIMLATNNAPEVLEANKDFVHAFNFATKGPGDYIFKSSDEIKKRAAESMAKLLKELSE